MLLTTEEIAKSIFKERPAQSHKGNFGHALIIAGNSGKMGAAIIAAKACLRSGAGLVTTNIPQEEKTIIQIAVPESMVCFRETFRDFNSYTAFAIGPGIGITADNSLLLEEILRLKRPTVIDADALTILSQNPNLLNLCHENCILTPHEVEFDRLFGQHSEREDRIVTARNWSKMSKSTLVLKGRKSIIVQDERISMNGSGNSGLAKGGSGDALTGIITALLCNNYDPYHAAMLGVYLHGMAAELALSSQSVESMLISDVIDNLGEAFKQIYS